MFKWAISEIYGDSHPMFCKQTTKCWVCFWRTFCCYFTIHVMHVFVPMQLSRTMLSMLNVIMICFLYNIFNVHNFLLYLPWHFTDRMYFAVYVWIQEYLQQDWNHKLLSVALSFILSQISGTLVPALYTVLVNGISRSICMNSYKNSYEILHPGSYKKLSPNHVKIFIHPH